MFRRYSCNNWLLGGLRNRSMEFINALNASDVSSLHVGCGSAPCLSSTSSAVCCIGGLKVAWSDAVSFLRTPAFNHSPIRSHRLLCGSLRWTLLHLMVESPTLVAQPHQALILKTNSYLITFRVRNPSSCWIDFSSGSLIRILMMRAWSDRNVFFIHLHYVPQSFTNLPASLFIHQIEWQSPHLEPYRKSWESHWVGCHTPFPSSEDQQDIVEAPRTVVQYPCQLAL